MSASHESDRLAAHRLRRDRGVLRRGPRTLRPGPPPLSRASWSTASSAAGRARRPGRRLRHRHRGPPVPGRGLRGLGVEPDERMAAFAAERGLRSRSRRSRPGTRPAALRTLTAGRPGTGSTRWPARRRRRAYCGPAGASRCSGTPSSSRRAREGLRAGLRRHPAGPPDVWHSAQSSKDIYATLRRAPPSDSRHGLRQAERWYFEWQRTYTRGEWLEQVPTFGGHALLPRGRSPHSRTRSEPRWTRAAGSSRSSTRR